MKNIIIGVLSVLLIGVVGYVLYDKVLTEDKNLNIQENENNEDSIHWVDYLLNNKINSVELNYCDLEEKADGGIPLLKSINITKDELSQILFPLKEEKVVKRWLAGTGCGGCCPSIVVDYTTDYGNYVFDYSFTGFDVYLKDSSLTGYSNDFADLELLKIIENSSYELDFSSLNNIPNNFDARQLFSIWTSDVDVFEENKNTPLYKVVVNNEN